MHKLIILFILIATCYIPVQAQSNDALSQQLEQLKKSNENLQHRLDILEKGIDDITWFHRIGDMAWVDKVYIYGPPQSKTPNPDAMGAKNPIKFWSYVFIPKDLNPDKKYPLIVFPHGGVHGNFSTYYTHIIRELIAQNYVVVAAEYRGSTGYGKSCYERIDYGGLEVDDVYASRNYMIENYDFIDKNRIGIIGWSHGGLITLMNIFDHPDDFKAAFAGVPVSDLIARMGYMTQDYRDLYSADYHIGQTAYENVAEYKRRSPAWNTHKFQNTPLLIHTNTIDDDVNVLEVQHLIKSLKADNKKFEYEIYQSAPGGHSFDRIDTKKARAIRLKIYRFLYPHLKPPVEFKRIKDLEKAAYRF